MNLADAIRKAAQETGTPLVMKDFVKPAAPEIQASAVIYKLPPIEEPLTIVPEELLDEDYEEMDNSPLTIGELTSQGFIKIEVHVPPDQLNKVLKSVVASQHSILTLREAAQHLRISISRLEDLAKTGEIPGFLVDGKWRFSRSKLESLQTPKGIDKEQNS